MIRRQQKQMAEADHKRFVGENLMIARTGIGKRQSEWLKSYPTYITSQGKLANWEKGDHYPPPIFLVRLCEDYGFTMDWFYRRRLAGVSSELVDGLRRAEAEISAASPEQEHRAPEA